MSVYITKSPFYSPGISLQKFHPNCMVNPPGLISSNSFQIIPLFQLCISSRIKSLLVSVPLGPDVFATYVYNDVAAFI